MKQRVKKAYSNNRYYGGAIEIEGQNCVIANGVFYTKESFLSIAQQQ